MLVDSNYPAINSEEVRSLLIPVPRCGEHIAIAAVLSNMATEITSLEQERDKTKLIKQEMMQELLTGKSRQV